MNKYVNKHMSRVESITLSCGEAVVYSLTSPQKDIGENEDACALIPIFKNSELLVLADGVGGHRGGQEASAIAIDLISKITAAKLESESLREHILNAIDLCNESLLTQKLGAATTVVIAEIYDKRVRTYCIGDSTILVTGQRGHIKFQSIAQSPVGYALESGLIEEDHAFVSENSHWVSNIIGSNDMHITMGPWLRLAVRDTLLMCSDGLTDNLSIEEIVATIRSGSLLDRAEQLKNQCQKKMLGEQGHADDLSFILFRPK